MAEDPMSPEREEGLDQGKVRDPVPGGPAGAVSSPMPMESTKRSKNSLLGILVVGFIIIAILVVAAAFLTMSVSIAAPDQNAIYPYSTTYSVSFPEGQPVTIGNSRIIVLSFENEMITDIDGKREKLAVGDERVVSGRHARVTSLGLIPVIDTNFQISLKYKGVVNNLANFDLTIRTSSQVPDYVIQRILPPVINARPAQL